MIPSYGGGMEALRKVKFPNTGIKKQWGGQGPSLPHPLLFHSSPCGQSLGTLEIRSPPPILHTYDGKKSKMIKNRTGENYLKSHHLRNFLASLIADRITSFVALFAGFLVIATNVL